MNNRIREQYRCISKLATVFRVIMIYIKDEDKGLTHVRFIRPDELPEYRAKFGDRMSF